MKRLSTYMPTSICLLASSRAFHQRFQRSAPATAPVPNQTDFVGRVLESWPDKSINTESTPSLIMRDMPEDVQEKIAEFGGLLAFCKKNSNFFGSKQVNGKAVIYLSEMAANILTQKNSKSRKTMDRVFSAPGDKFNVLYCTSNSFSIFVSFMF